MLWQTWGKTIVFANYLLNKEYISEVLCVKKQVPQSDCEGRCQLKKQLQEEENKTLPAGTLKEKSEPLFLPLEGMARVCIPLVSDSAPFPFSQKTPPCVPLKDIFHPPQTV